MRKWFLLSALVCSSILPCSLSAQQPLDQTLPHNKIIVGSINNSEITKADLMQELLERRGRKHQNLMVERIILDQEAKKQGINLTEKEINEELLNHIGNAKSPEEFEKKELRPQGKNLACFKIDTVIPTLQLRLLAERKINVTDAQVRQAFERLYGENVICRFIVCKTVKDALQIHSQINGSRQKFLAAEQTVAANETNKNLFGLKPVPHTSNPDLIEKRAFELKDGEISEVLPTPEKRGVIILRERLQASTIDRLDYANMSKMIRRHLINENLKDVVIDLEFTLQKDAKIELAKGELVCTVNGFPITRTEIAEELIQRYGGKHVESMLYRRMVEMEAEKLKVKLTNEDVQAEVLRMVKANNCKDLPMFENEFLARQGMTLAEYQLDVVRTRMLLQSIAREQLKLTEEDLKKEFDKQFGSKVICRMIALNDPRQADDAYKQIGNRREVFIDFARRQPNPNLKALAGLMPPIARFATNDIIERTAFELKDGEISGVLQAPEGGYVILLRENLAPADSQVKFEEVKDILQVHATETKCKDNVPQIIESLKGKYTFKNYLEPWRNTWSREEK